MARSVPLVLALAALLLDADARSALAQLALPDDLALIQPAADVPAEAAAFAGAWGDGAWDGSFPHALVVERIEADGSAQIVLAGGAGDQPALEPGWRRWPARIAKGRLSVVADGAVSEYELAQDGTLLGRRTLIDGWRSYVHLMRVAAARPAEIAVRLLEPAPRLWQELRIPVTSAVGTVSGKTFLLQTTLYPSPMPGRRPLVILNHGTQEAGTRHARRFEEQARVFLALGYSVAAPMRKGHAESEGPLLEASVLPEEVQLGSALEDLDAVVGYLANAPAVDPQRIILAGQDRGGFLAIAYASRHPSRIAAVVNFSGLWRSEHLNDGFNMDEFRKAGRTMSVPSLWLYADNDARYPLKAVRTDFAAFRAAGGAGRLVEMHGIAGDGHALFTWVESWRELVSEELKRVIAML